MNGTHIVLEEKIGDLGEESASLVRRVSRAYRALRIPECAAALTFYTLLASIPLLAFMFFGANMLKSGGFFESEFPSLIGSILGADGTFVAGQLVAGALSVGAHLFTSLVGLALFFWSASNIFTYIRLTMLRIFKRSEGNGNGEGIIQGIIQRTIKARFLALLYMFGFFLLLTGVMLAHVYLRELFTTADSAVGLPLPPEMAAVLSALGGFVIALGFFTVLYFFIAHTLIWRDALVGGLVAGIGFTAANIIFSALFIESPVFQLYGGVGAFVVFGMYLYYLYMTLFVGALAGRYHALGRKISSQEVGTLSSLRSQ